MSKSLTPTELKQVAQPYVVKARLLRASHKCFSDLIDAEGYQYIDLILEGGGTLGIALLGYIYVLEEAGLRFRGLGGTSAGAITAMALACVGPPSIYRSDRLLSLLANMPMDQFVDGKSADDKDAAYFVSTWLKPKNLWKRLLSTVQIIDNLLHIQGLNRGQFFFDWLSQALSEYNGGKRMTLARLDQQMRTFAELWIRDSVKEEDLMSSAHPVFEKLANGRKRYLVCPNASVLHIVAADISTKSKVEFPAHAELYWQNVGEVGVAEFVRASMSIPGFFAPHRVPALPVDYARPLWQKVKTDWAPEGFAGDFLPKEHCFVDGGILSNFPIAAFHAKGRMPVCPTFGVKLQWDEHNQDITNLIDIIRCSLSTSQGALDSDFIAKHPDYKQLVAYIDTGSISWVNFAMPNTEKIELFYRGAQAAAEFLETFDWEHYKDVRRELLQAELLTLD